MLHYMMAEMRAVVTGKFDLLALRKDYSLIVSIPFSWKVEDVTNFDRNAEQFPVLMSRLEPYTQYAYYVKTYTIASEPYGGQSEIQYLTTDPDKPDPVQRLTALSNGSSEIVSDSAGCLWNVHGSEFDF